MFADYFANLFVNYVAQLRQLGRPFTLMLASELATLTALLAGHLTLAWWIATGGGAKELAIYGVATALASFIAIPLLSPLGDRYPKRRLMSISFVVIASESVLLAILAHAGYYSLPVVIACEMIGVCAMAVINPCMQTIASELVTPEQLPLAIRLQKSSGSIGGILGPALGGSILAAGGVSSALWLHVALLLVAAVCAARMPKIVRAVHRKEWGLAHWWHDLRAGLSIKWHIPLERNWTLTNLALGIFYAPAMGMMVPLCVKALGLSAFWLGATEMGFMLGMLLGFLGASSTLASQFGRFHALIGAFLLRAIALVSIGITITPLFLVVAFFLLGIAQSTTQFVGVTHRLLAMPADFRARNASTNFMAWQISSTLGPAVAGLALIQTSVAQCYVVFGLIIACGTIGIALIPQIQNFLSLNHDTVDGWYGREYPALFREKSKPS